MGHMSLDGLTLLRNRQKSKVHSNLLTVLPFVF